MATKWTITLNGTPISGGTSKKFVERVWECTCDWIMENGGHACLLRGRTMVAEERYESKPNGRKE